MGELQNSTIWLSLIPVPSNLQPQVAAVADWDLVAKAELVHQEKQVSCYISC